MTSRFPKHLWIVLLLAFGAFLMSALISQYVFQRLPHLEDEVAYLYQAKMYAGLHLVIPTPQPQRSYWMPFLVDQGGLRFGKYTPGWSMQLAIGVLLGQTWIINAFFSALTIPLVYRLGKEIFNPDVGVVAAALTMFSPMALLLDGTLMGHTSALFAAMLFLYAYWRLERGKRRAAWGIIAGLSLGILVANRPITGIALAVPLIIWSIARLYHALAYDIARLRGKIPPIVPPSTPSPLPNMVLGAGFQASPSGTAAMVYPMPQVDQPKRSYTAFAPLKNIPVQGFFPTLWPLILLSIFALLISASIPIYNEAAVHNPTTELYTLVWSYDTIGFGPCCGRAPHDIGKGILQARFDLSLTAADLFGWELGSLCADGGTDCDTTAASDVFGGVGGSLYEANSKMNPVLQDHLLNQGDYWELIGLSWILLPPAFIVAYRKKAIFIVIWTVVAYGLVLFALKWQDGAMQSNWTFSWIWLITALIWLYLPIIFWRDQQRAWTWLLWSAVVGLVVMQMAYWIGSQRYSTRYFFEGLGAIAIISALPIAWLARRISRPVIYGLFALALAYSFYFYSIPRIAVLTGYNFINSDVLADLQAHRNGTGQPVLVIVNSSNAAWRAYGALMAQTSPYLNSDIVVAWNYEGDQGDVYKQIVARFPGRQIIEMDASGNYAWFEDEKPPPEVASG